MHSLLARMADGIFWMARYLERAENLARILDVTQAFAQDRRSVDEWLPIVDIHADRERFEQLHAQPSVGTIIDFYVFDRGNPSSMLASLTAARDNARTLRPLISTEMWTQLNVLHHQLADRSAQAVRLRELSSLCASIKEGCQTQVGVTEGTLYRDQLWHFYQLGKYLERADQTTRLLDIAYHRLETTDPSVEASQWFALLRSAAGYHAFRRAHPHGMRAPQVVQFLLQDPRFPRSVALCVGRANTALHRLGTDYGLPRDEALHEAMAAIEHELTPSDRPLETELHDHMDRIQRRIVDITTELGQSYFGHEAPPKPT